MKLRFTLIAAAVAGLLVPFGAGAAVIDDSYVQASINTYGTLGSGNKRPGILFDASGSGNYGINDFLAPFGAFEGLYITSSAGSYQTNNIKLVGPQTSFAPFSLTQNSPTSITAGATSLDGLLSISNRYDLSTDSGRAVIAITTTLTNASADAIDNLAFLRALDADPDYAANGDYKTLNTILSNDQACAEGAITGQAVCIFTAATYTHKAGISHPDWSTDPLAYLAGINGGNDDNLIGIGFDLGSLAAGGSLSFSYGYAFGETLAIASTNTGGGGGAVPEPTTVLLAASGLLSLAASRRTAQRNG